MNKSITISTFLVAAVLSVPAAAFPTEWGNETCAAAGLRPGTKTPAWCPAVGSKGCVPCPRGEPVQVKNGGRKAA